MNELGTEKIQDYLLIDVDLTKPLDSVLGKFAFVICICEYFLNPQKTKIDFCTKFRPNPKKLSDYYFNLIPSIFFSTLWRLFVFCIFKEKNHYSFQRDVFDFWTKRYTKSQVTVGVWKVSKNFAPRWANLREVGPFWYHFF